MDESKKWPANADDKPVGEFTSSAAVSGTPAVKATPVSKPADTKSADTKSADTKSADTKSADTKSADTKSADTKSADTKSADTKSADTRTPAEWKEQLRTPAYEYGPAELLHDWAAHALHANGGKQMSRATYVQAIKAGCAPDKHGEYTPVPEAQGDYQPDGKPRL